MSELHLIAMDMADVLESHPAASGLERCIVILADDDGSAALIQRGHDSDAAIATELLAQTKAIFEAHGSTLLLAPIAGEG